MALLPLARRALRRSLRRDGRVTGVIFGLGLLFAYLFEPAKAAAIESIETKKDAGDAESAWGGEQF